MRKGMRVMSEGCRGSGVAVMEVARCRSRYHIPPRDDIVGRELFEDETRQGTNVEGIELHEGIGHGIVPGFAQGIGPHEMPLVGGDRLPTRLQQEPLLARPVQHPVDRCWPTPSGRHGEARSGVSRVPQRGYC